MSPADPAPGLDAGATPRSKSRFGLPSTTGSIALSDRVSAMERAVSLVAGRSDDDVVDRAAAVLDKARGRLRHGSEHTVIALAGSTGVGKSSLLNAIVGDDVSTIGVRRPTTSVVHAAVWGDDSGELLDWLGVGRRHVVSGGRSADELSGLVLVDLPDFDSTEVSHRVEVDRLVELVDLLIWVTDPQKYADEALHDRYLRPLADHGDVMGFVINKMDAVAADQHRALIDDFGRRLREDGIGDPAVVPASVASGAGVHQVRALISDAVSQRRAVVARLEADLRRTAFTLETHGSSDGISKRARRDLVEQLGRAAGVDSAGNIVATQHRRDAASAMGWPPARLLTGFRRRQPIVDLPRAHASAVAGSEIDIGLRDIAEAAGNGLAAPWPGTLRRTAIDHADDLRTQLTALTQQVARDSIGRPGWWTAVQTVQRIFVAVAALGALWLLTLAVLGGFLRLDTDPLLIDTPGASWIPLPSALLLGGLVCGLLLAVAVRIPVGVAAARRARQMRSRLHRRVGALADTVIADLEAVLDDHRELRQQLAIAQAP